MIKSGRWSREVTWTPLHKSLKEWNVLMYPQKEGLHQQKSVGDLWRWWHQRQDQGPSSGLSCGGLCLGLKLAPLQNPLNCPKLMEPHSARWPLQFGFCWTPKPPSPPGSSKVVPTWRRKNLIAQQYWKMMSQRCTVWLWGILFCQVPVYVKIRILCIKGSFNLLFNKKKMKESKDPKRVENPPPLKKMQRGW